MPGLMSDDQRKLVESGELNLRTQEGEVVVRLSVPPTLPLMVANGYPPSGLVWGQRVFFLSPEGQYVEGLLMPILGASELT